MFIYKPLILSLILLILFSCKNKTHRIIFTKEKLVSETLIPPTGCYKVKITAHGVLNCESKLIILMDSEKTNFLDHLTLKGSFIENEIHFSDWYENPFQVSLNPDSCIIEPFEIQVHFFN